MFGELYTQNLYNILLIVQYLKTNNVNNKNAIR